MSSYAMLACEVLSSDVAALNDAIISNEALLQDFLKFMDAPAPLDPIRASYFARIFTLLLQKKTGEVRRVERPALRARSRLPNTHHAMHPNSLARRMARRLWDF